MDENVPVLLSPAGRPLLASKSRQRRANRSRNSEDDEEKYRRQVVSLATALFEGGMVASGWPSALYIDLLSIANP